jgi:glycerol-3-phosphate acyltransferase PlsY
MALIIFSIVSYLIGAFPTGQILARLNGIDLTTFGSGNVGATNVSRALGKKAGLYTLIADVLKGYIAVLLATLFAGTPVVTALAALAVVLGHCFSIPRKLKGGKGVATAFGVLVFMSPECAGLAALIFLLVLFIFRFVSLASICATISGPIWALFYQLPEPFSYSLMCIALVVVARHRANLKRLVEGSEPKIGRPTLLVANPQEKSTK